MPYADKRNRALYDARRRAEVPPRSFVGVDGEGGSDGAGNHVYSLLRSGYEYIYRPTGLSSRECLEFLHRYGLNHRDEIMVSYFFDYDVTMMLKDWPKRSVDYLLDRKGALWHFARYQDFQVDYIPGKRLAIKHHGATVIIHDCSGFFQSSFLKAIDLWDVPSPVQREEIEVGKLSRSGFSAEMTEREISYNRLEVVLLADLMERFREVCEELGLTVRNWEGAGNVATALFGKYKTPKAESHNVAVQTAMFCRNAYYGGRFEILEAGPHEKVWELDIASAYPSAMLKLPCLKHTKWKKFTGNPPDYEFYCARLSYETPSSSLWGPFPCRRKDGSIYFPLSGDGWYWSPEIRMAEQALGTVISHKAGYYAEESCDCRTFDWIRHLYDERLRIGKNGKGIVLKLGLNSLYGKCAQSVGSPRYASPIWAGLITSITRSQLLDVFNYHEQDKVLMFATDAAYLLEPPKFPVTDRKELGMFEASEPHSLFICKPGFYFSNDSATVKSRGISARYLTGLREKFLEAWECRGYAGYVDVHEIQTFIGLRMARQLTTNPLLGVENGFEGNETYDAGRWVERTMRLRFDPSSKRVTKSGQSRTFPYRFSSRTTPYAKTMGVVDDLIYTHPDDNNLAFGLPER